MQIGHLKPSIDNVLKQYPGCEVGTGSWKLGTTSARRLRHDKFEISESPIYETGIRHFRKNGTPTMDVINPLTIDELISLTA